MQPRLMQALRHARRAPEVVRCARKTREWRKLTGAYVGLTPCKLPFDVHMKDGNAFQFTEFYDIETLWQVYFHHAYEARHTDRVIIDAGANIGLFTCLAARVAAQAQVYAYEPAPSTFRRLQQHVASNGLSDRVKCFPIAVGGDIRPVEMFVEGQSSQRSRLAATGNPNAEAINAAANRLFSRVARVEKQSLTSILDSVRQDANTATIDLIKMDIETCEYEALMPERLEGVERLQLEYHPPEAPEHSLPRLIKHIEDCGLRLARRVGDDNYGLLWYER